MTLSQTLNLLNNWRYCKLCSFFFRFPWVVQMFVWVAPSLVQEIKNFMTLRLTLNNRNWCFNELYISNNYYVLASNSTY